MNFKVNKSMLAFYIAKISKYFSNILDKKCIFVYNTKREIRFVKIGGNQ